jgi:hypothetical protein
MTREMIVESDLRLAFDFDQQTLEIFGVKYALGLFSFLGRDPLGSTVTVLQRADGVVTIQQQSETDYKRRVMRDLLREIGERLSLLLEDPLATREFDGKDVREYLARIERATS